MAQQEKPKQDLVSMAAKPSSPDHGKPLVVDIVRDPIPPEGLYWFGALPAIGKKKFIINASEPDWSRPRGLEYTREVEGTSYDAWFNLGETAEWKGKCEYLQNIPGGGWDFPAFTDFVNPDRMNPTQINRIPYPGHVAKMNEHEVRSILEKIVHEAIRPNPASPRKSHENCKLVDYRDSHIPGCKGGIDTAQRAWNGRCMTCSKLFQEVKDQRWIQYWTSALGKAEWRQPGDLPISDFVYLQRLEADVNTPAERYHTLVPTLDVFFQNPPPPLSIDITKLEAKAAVA